MRDDSVPSRRIYTTKKTYERKIANIIAVAAKCIPISEGTGFRSKLRIIQFARRVLIQVVKNCSTNRPTRNGIDSRDSTRLHNEAFSPTQPAMVSTTT